jgi:hypothetical protein
MRASRKREREDWESFRITFDDDEVVKKPMAVAAPPSQPLIAITAKALVENPSRLEHYVKNMPQEYLFSMLDVIASGCNLSPMAALLQNNNYFWYLVLQRRMAEGFHARVDYKTMVGKAYGL